MIKGFLRGNNNFIIRYLHTQFLNIHVIDAKMSDISNLYVVPSDMIKSCKTNLSVFLYIRHYYNFTIQNR